MSFLGAVQAGLNFRLGLMRHRYLTRIKPSVSGLMRLHQEYIQASAEEQEPRFCLFAQLALGFFHLFRLLLCSPYSDARNFACALQSISFKLFTQHVGHTMTYWNICRLQCSQACYKDAAQAGASCFGVACDPLRHMRAVNRQRVRVLALLADMMATVG